jgi:hypothetical protein
METTIFLLDAIAMTVLVFTSLQNDKRRLSEKQTGLFRYSDMRRIMPKQVSKIWQRDPHIVKTVNDTSKKSNKV